MSRFLDFTPVREKRLTLAELTRGLTPADLRELTHSMVDAMLSLLTDCRDEDVTFVPRDPRAHDPYASDPAAADAAWTLAHVIVHTTASAEESAFLAAEMARGVPNHGRSRYEVDWRTLTTLEQCRQRLEESRRMRVATLDLWPDAPHLEVTHTPYPGAEAVNAVQMFVFGLLHDDDHRQQIAEIVRQAKQRRNA
jgi:hypothetical protein